MKIGDKLFTADGRERVVIDVKKNGDIVTTTDPDVAAQYTKVRKTTTVAEAKEKSAGK